MNKSTPIDSGGVSIQPVDGPISDDDVYSLEAMIEQMNQATDRASNALDDALTFVAESNIRIRKLEAN